MMRRSFFGAIKHQMRFYTAVGNQQEIRNTLGTPIADELVSEFGNYYMIKKLFRTHPELKDSHIFFWKTFTKVLSKFGFQPRDCFRIIDLCPTILGYDEEKLEKVLDEWCLQTRLSLSDLKFLMLNRPEFLTLDCEHIKNRIPFLQNFSPSKEALMTFLFLCPNVMVDDWDETMRKLKFLNDEMVVYRSEILSTRAMSKSMDFIKLRFSILEKCGKYTKPSIHLHKQTQKERLKLNNPKLKDITDKSDQKFARKIAKISEEEYDTYSDAFYAYKNEADDDETSDESDDD